MDILFQSTRPRGARRLLIVKTNTVASFNPRARGGRDVTVSLLRLMVSGFNPRARGGRDK